MELKLQIMLKSGRNLAPCQACFLFKFSPTEFNYVYSAVNGNRIAALNAHNYQVILCMITPVISAV